MFISFGNRRINIGTVKEYKPVNKSSNNKIYYIIEFHFLDGKKEDLYFFDKINERDKFLEILDKNFLNI